MIEISVPEELRREAVLCPEQCPWPARRDRMNLVFARPSIPGYRRVSSTFLNVQPWPLSSRRLPACRAAAAVAVADWLAN